MFYAKAVVFSLSFFSFLSALGSFFLRSFHISQIEGEMNIDENVPASKPTIMGRANTESEKVWNAAPIIATIAIVIKVVSDVFIERTKVSLIDAFAMSVAVLFLWNTDLVFSRIRSNTIIVLLIE